MKVMPVRIIPIHTTISISSIEKPRIRRCKLSCFLGKFKFETFHCREVIALSTSRTNCHSSSELPSPSPEYEKPRPAPIARPSVVNSPHPRDTHGHRQSTAVLL